VADPQWLVEDAVEVPVQVNGKLRARLVVPVGTTGEVLQATAEADEAVQRQLEGKTVVRVIVVPGRLVNFVVK
jgi:leucyl-tRNA synthetase